MRIALVVFFFAGVAHAQSAPLHAAIPTKAELGTACALGAKWDGSLHAATLPATLVRAPSGGKTQLSYRCDDTPAALYLFDFGSAEEAATQVTYIAARLWGGEGPTAEHPDELLSSGGVVAVVSSDRPGPLRAILERKQMKRHVTSGLVGSIGDATLPDADLPPSTTALLKKALARSRGVETYTDALDKFDAGQPLGKKSVALLGAALRVDVDDAGALLRVHEEADFVVADERGAGYGSIAPPAPNDPNIAAWLFYIHRQADFDHGTAPKASVDALAAARRVLGGVLGEMVTDSRRYRSITVGRSTVYAQNSHVYMRRAPGAIILVEAFDSGRLFYIGVFPEK